MYTYICLKSTKFRKINAGNSLSEFHFPLLENEADNGDRVLVTFTATFIAIH